MAGGPGDVKVEIVRFAAFRRDLQKLDRNTNLELSRYIREGAKKVRDEARSRAPVLTGALQKSIKHSVTQKQASVYSMSPYSAVHEWGGTIRPRGVPIKIKRSQMVRGAAADLQDETTRHLERMFDRIANKSGFH